ncbi:MAG: CRISPR-associated endonuclease Cas1 2 [Methanosaeta sp. PtaU1.Bin060]|nr:MAG: CRISPR-associated endonuclease Cas1 2 [Methanosaeta sp. PtaU1.Bin060]
MQLVINSYGSYLRKNGNCFQVKRDDKSFEVAVGKINSILITTAASVTTDAIKLAVDNNIDIVFLNAYGEPYGRVWHPKLGSTTLIRRKQLEIYENSEGLNLVKEWGLKKLDNQIKLLERLRKTRDEKRGELDRYIDDISESRERMKRLRGTIEAKRQDMLGLEGRASRAYFEAISMVMPEKYRFAGRSRNPAKDEFNALLNYGYGILYSLVEKACIISGLDPYVGFLHTDSYNKMSLVFDIIEMFRIYIDEPVIYLFSRRMVKDEFFEPLEQGVGLSKDGKAALIEAVNKALEETIAYRGRNVKTRNTIQMECHRIANGLIRPGEEPDVEEWDMLVDEGDLKEGRSC